MAADGYWAIGTTEAGPIGEKIKYFTPGEVPPRSERKRRADLRKQRQNEKNANRRVARIIHAKWPMGSGTHQLLTYIPEGVKKLTAGADCIILGCGIDGVAACRSVCKPAPNRT